MRAQIDIKTPSGKSLEGFPKQIELEGNEIYQVSYQFDNLCDTLNLTLTPSDKITIEIL